MIYGVTIDDINTLEEWGLLLLADVTIGAATVKTNYIEIPEADGALDLTAALTGVPVYANREISFTLFAGRRPGGAPGPANEWELERIKSDLSGYCNGQKRRLWLPDDPGHYFTGRMQIGDKSGYNSGQIPVTMTADPWRYKNEPTAYTLAAGVYRLSNEGRRAIPTFETEAAAQVIFGDTTYQLAPGENRFEDLVFTAGLNEIQISGTAPVTVIYQEAHL